MPLNSRWSTLPRNFNFQANLQTSEVTKTPEVLPQGSLPVPLPYFLFCDDLDVILRHRVLVLRTQQGE